MQFYCIAFVKDQCSYCLYEILSGIWVYVCCTSRWHYINITVCLYVFFFCQHCWSSQSDVYFFYQKQRISQHAVAFRYIHSCKGRQSVLYPSFVPYNQIIDVYSNLQSNNLYSTKLKTEYSIQVFCIVLWLRLVLIPLNHWNCNLSKMLYIQTEFVTIKKVAWLKSDLKSHW